MGGHFPSLSYRRTLDLLPQLDSVVRFEGELTLLELGFDLGTSGLGKDDVHFEVPDGLPRSSPGAVGEDLQRLETKPHCWPV
jgi:hypothetical protein